MTISVELQPEVQTELARLAAAKGVDIQTYAASLLEEAACLDTETDPPHQRSIEMTLQEMAQFSHKIPLLPDEAFSRESIYQDHD